VLDLLRFGDVGDDRNERHPRAAAISAAAATYLVASLDEHLGDPLADGA
jgi:hypothetical protein